MEVDAFEIERRNAATWRVRLAPYVAPNLKRSVWQGSDRRRAVRRSLGLDVCHLAVSYWLTLVLAVPTAFFLIRLFIVQHDCGHGAFFRSTRAGGNRGLDSRRAHADAVHY